VRQTICNGCGEQINEPWKTAGVEIKPYNWARIKEDTDLPGDYCEDCSTVVREAIREAFSDE
jgi:hypothetical protein